MKKLLVIFGIILVLLGVTYSYKNDIVNFLAKYLKNKEVVTLGSKNEYYRDYNFDFVQNTDNFSPKSKQDIYNIYYTVINAGKNKFTFYCPDEYKECITEIKALANDQTTLSHINNFVHPYNGFKHIETEYDASDKVTISIDKTYTKDMISTINTKVKSVENELFDSSLSKQNQIKAIHNYIINNSTYDSDRSDNNIVNYSSDNAYGPLLEGHGLCGGYTDSMALFLEDLKIKNYKVSSDSHVWNAVSLSNNWYHLDLTWDDPITKNGTNLLEYNYFLISTAKLNNLSDNQHQFSQNIYQELKIK